MRFLFLNILSICVLIGGIPSVLAEKTSPAWFYRAWQTEDGLPDNSISGVAQSPDGYLWVGTNGGAIRFNGMQFSPLPLRDVSGLPSRQVRAMNIDQSGNLWLGMERGPVIRVGESSFRTFHRADGLINGVTMSMVDDLDGNTWIAFPRGVCFIKNDTVTKLAKIPHGKRVNVVCDTDGQVWLASGGKFGRLNEDGFQAVRDFGSASLRIAVSRKSGVWIAADSDLMLHDSEDQFRSVFHLPEGVVVSDVFEDRDGATWIGTQRSGLYRGEGGRVVKVATSHPAVTCLTDDHEGNIWVGTAGGGLNLIRPRAVQFIDESEGLPFAAVRSTACDTSGRVWSVSEDGQLAQKGEAGWSLFEGIDEGFLMTCVAASPRGGVWVGTRNRGLLRIEGDQVSRYRVKDGLASPFVRSLLVSRSGDVWIAGSEPDRLYRLRDGMITQIAHPGVFRAIRGMAETANGTVWIGTSDGILFRVEGDTLIDESDVDGPNALSVRTLHATSDGSLWIGYAGDGLGHLKNGQYKRITTEVGLFDDYISQIQDDGEGALWIAANRGLFQVELDDLLDVSTISKSSEQLRCRVFGSNDGVPSIQPSRDYAPAAGRGANGSLYFSTHSGIVEVLPEKPRENPLPPPVVFEKVLLDGQVTALYQKRSLLGSDERPEQTNLSLPTAKLKLPPDHDKLVIHFAALSLGSPENILLRYRLSPLDKGWEQIDNQHSVTLPRLPAGDYQFQVIACNNAGVWNEEGATLSIAVQPFYWETWPFRIGAGVLTALIAGGMVFLALRRNHGQQLQRIAAKQAIEQERSRIARDIHDDLGASLTRITLLSQSSTSQTNEAGKPVLDKIHATSRDLMRSMEEVVWAVNPEHDTFDALANYLSNYAQGFLGVADVRCRLEMPMSLPHLPLSAQIRHNLFLAFKEALNNAVKHARASEVRISLELGSDAFVLKVKDDGEGFDSSAAVPALMRATSGSGLGNMKNRMEEIGGTCTIESKLGHGSTVEFNVPLKIHAQANRVP